MKPKLFTMIKNKEFSKERIIKDIIAGIIVAIIALPLSIALGISSGVTPEKGLITAILAGFFISFLGGSKVQIGGPTGAFVVTISSIIAQYGLNGLITATIMAGIILIIMGLLKLGNLIKYIPKTITVGFTAGIAITLLSTQVKDFFGLKIETVPSEFIPKWKEYISNFNSLDIATMLIGIISVVLIAAWPIITKKIPIIREIPGSMVALVVATLLVMFVPYFGGVETIGDRFGDLSSNIPPISFPNIDIDTINKLFTPALTIAILGALESLLSAVVADEMIADTHDSNTELIAQGVGNIASGLFGGIPATGAIARTAANAKSGGKSPIAGMVHAITLLLIMLLLMPLAKLIPMTALAAILVVVSYNMSGWRVFKALLKAPKSDIIVLLITFFCTVVFDLVVAIGFGMIMTMFLFMKRVSETTLIKDLVAEEVFDDKVNNILDELDEKILVYQINGPLFFGIVQDFMKEMKTLDLKTEVLILDIRHAGSIDASAVAAMKEIYRKCKQYNIRFIITHVQEQPMKTLKKMGFVKMIGGENIYESKVEAIKNAVEYINKK